MRGLLSGSDEDADYTDYFLLHVVFIHSGIGEHLLYSRLYLVTGDTGAVSLSLICTKEAHQLVNLCWIHL